MARTSSFTPGSILRPKKEEAADAPDMTERIVARTLAKGAEAPQPTKETPNEASVAHYDIGTSDNKDNKTSDMAASAGFSSDASEEMAALTIQEYVACALPTSPDAVRKFLVGAAKFKRESISLRVPLALDVLVSRIAGGHVAIKKVYKSDFIKRCLQLGLYELYTGKRLVTFGDEDEDE